MKVYKVEIKGKRATYTFPTKEEAEAYAVTMTAWSGGQYRITPIIVGETKVLTAEGVKILESTKIDISEEVAK